MDKWREIELAKMRVGGNQKARDFLESQSDYRPKWTMQEKYMSRASALLREKVFRHLRTFVLRAATTRRVVLLHSL